MFTTLLKNRICRGSNGYNCTICNLEIADEEKASKHVTENKNHIEKLENLISPKNIRLDEKQLNELINNGIVLVNSKEYKCTFCSCSIPKLDHIPEHIAGKKHLTKRRKILSDFVINDLMNLVTYDDQKEIKKNSCSVQSDINQDKTVKECSNDSIELNTTTICCSICQDNLISDSALKYHKMFHLNYKNPNMLDIISFFVRENTKTIYCLICDCIIENEEYLEKHLEEVCHQKRLIILCCPNSNAIMNVINEFNRYLYYLGCNIYYNVFQNTVQNNHINNKYKEQETISTNISQAQLQQNTQNSNNSVTSEYFCFICNTKFIEENFLFLHYNYDYVHKYRMEAINLILKDKNMKFITYFNNEIIKCLKCHIQLTELNGAVAHLFEIHHVIEKEINEKMVSNNLLTINNVDVPKNMYICPLCKINVTHDYMMVQHLESDYHKNRLHEYYANISCTSFEKIIFSCPLCKMNFFNDRTLLEHFYHSHGFKNMIQMNNIILANSTNLFLFTNNMFINGMLNPGVQQYCDAKYKSTNFVPLNNFNNLVNLNLNKDNQQKSTIDIKKQKNFIRKDNEDTLTNTKKRTKNLIDFSPRYVKLCAEIGAENIFKINTERMRKLQLGISLTFPYESNRGCIPCGYEISSDLQHLYEHLRTEEHENNLQEMEENDEFFQNYRDQFSDLELAKSYLYEDSDEWIKCLTCDTKVENHNDSIRNHIDSESHVENYNIWKKSECEISLVFNYMFENLWYYIEKFFCNVCCVTFKFVVDYARHLENPEHIKKVEKKILKKQCLQFDFCILCSRFWYAKSDHHSNHCNSNSHKYILKSRDFTVPKMPDSAKLILNFIEETINDLLVESDKVTISQKKIESELLELIETAVKSKYPLAKAYLFGSRISYLEFKDSDLDIYIDCKNQYKETNSKNECLKQLLVVQECFHKHQDVWVIEEIVLRARIPIIKLRHRQTNLNCDVSFTNGLGVEKSKILSYYTGACLPCRKLILFFKKWISYCQLSGPKCITTFAISWLVIFYLQVKGFLPSVKQLIELENNSKIVAGWETGVSKTILRENINLSITDLLQGFFSFYSKFDYISDVVCPFLGKTMKKSQFLNIKDLPEEMNNYKIQINEEKVEFFRLDSPMCIQEPIDLSQNLAKSVTKLQLRMFKQYCTESTAILQSSNLLNANKI